MREKGCPELSDGNQMKAHTKNHLLTICRRELGLGCERCHVVAEAVAARLGVAVPEGKAQKYALLARFAESLTSAQKAAKVPTRWVPYRASSGDLVGTAFLNSYEWRTLRMVVLKKRGARCECCGATPDDGIRINDDHVKPRKLFPDLALDESNLQVLCETCNAGKGNWDSTDWRPESRAIDTATPKVRLVRRKS